MPERSADIRVVTFNTAAGNPRVATPQRAFLELPFYREVFDGAADAAIVALQEIGRPQAAALRERAREGGFELLQIARPGQGNALLVPARFALLARRSRYLLASPLRALAGRPRPAWRQLLELRMWSCAHLRDRATGRELAVFNTHLSGDPALRPVQARALLARVHAAGARRPVVLLGDLNVAAAPGADARHNAADAEIRAQLAPLADMAAAARDPRGPAIDWILARGLEPVAARLYRGDALRLPGIGDAEAISDHYAKEAVLRYVA